MIMAWKTAAKPEEGYSETFPDKGTP